MTYLKKTIHSLSHKLEEIATSVIENKLEVENRELKQRVEDLETSIQYLMQSQASLISEVKAFYLEFMEHRAYLEDDYEDLDRYKELTESDIH